MKTINPRCRCGHPMRWHRETSLIATGHNDCLAATCACISYHPPSIGRGVVAQRRRVRLPK